MTLSDFWLILLPTHISLQSTFAELGVQGKLLDSLARLKFHTPTHIQHQVIPIAFQGKDVVGIAQTGTGKTFAFGIPMIQRIALHGGQGLILVPTRELALQVEEALNDIGRSIGLRCVVLIGGVSQSRQVKALKMNPHIVVATPGRLDDLLRQGLYRLDRLSMITLDEADRMLDIGFLPQIRRIFKIAPVQRQTLLFSATMPPSIASLTNEFMQKPLQIEIAPQGTSAENVEQEVFVVSKEHKVQLLRALLGEYNDRSVLIFTRTKHAAKRLAKQIRDMGHSATEIHSNRTQSQRKAALSGFSKGRYRVMVATDIAARGIDVESISLVVNFDLPETSEDYVHRIGRTGRAGRSGKAVSFMTGDQRLAVRKIERLIRKPLSITSHPSVPVERVLAVPERRTGRGQGGRGRAGGRRRVKKSYARKPYFAKRY